MVQPPVVKLAHLDPDCEGCQAARRALDGGERLVIDLQKINKARFAEIKELKKLLDARYKSGVAEGIRQEQAKHDSTYWLSQARGK